MKNCKMKPPFCPLCTVLCHPFTDTRHRQPVLLIKKIITDDPYFVNKLRDASLDVIRFPRRAKRTHAILAPGLGPIQGFVRVFDQLFGRQIFARHR